MILRPYAVVISGRLERGLELAMSGPFSSRERPMVEEVRPHTGIPGPYVISAAFVNAHSHLEYRGLMGRLASKEYWPWLREITVAKMGQSMGDVRSDCRLAAFENKATGVAMIGEHSDRPLAGEALAQAGIGGVIFQEVITLNEPDGPQAKIERVWKAAELNRAAFDDHVYLSPHAYFTVDRETLATFGERPDGNAGFRSTDTKASPISIHVAESIYESELTREGRGPIADLYSLLGKPHTPTGKGIAETLADLGLARACAQWVHCCDVSAFDIELIAGAGVTVAHCPRSNTNLDCPTAPIREMLDAGISVGLGLDSAASSGPIDMFAEMRAALKVSVDRGGPLTPEEVWLMATTMGADSLPIETPRWDIEAGSYVPLIAIYVPGATCIEDLIERGSPDRVTWFDACD